MERRGGRWAKRASEDVPHLGGIFRRTSITDEQLSAQLSDGDKAFLKARVADPSAQKRIEDLTQTAAYATNMEPTQVVGGVRELNRMFGAAVNGDYVNSIADASKMTGATWDQQISAATQYAEISGYQPGGVGYKQAFDQWNQFSSVGAQAEASAKAQRYAQMGSQIQGAMPLSMNGCRNTDSRTEQYPDPAANAVSGSK